MNESPTVESLQAQLAERDAAIARLTRDRTVDDALIAEHPVDLHAARLLALDALGDKPVDELPATLQQLKAAKPQLFARPPRAASASGTRVIAPAGDSIERAAESALQTGSRRDLLRYLRLRRRK